MIIVAVISPCVRVNSRTVSDDSHSNSTNSAIHGLGVSVGASDNTQSGQMKHQQSCPVSETAAARLPPITPHHTSPHHQQGLEEQLLAQLVRAERPELEEARDSLITSISADKRQLQVGAAQTRKSLISTCLLVVVYTARRVRHCMQCAGCVLNEPDTRYTIACCALNVCCCGAQQNAGAGGQDPAAAAGGDRQPAGRRNPHQHTQQLQGDVRWDGIMLVCSVCWCVYVYMRVCVVGCTQVAGAISHPLTAFMLPCVKHSCRAKPRARG